MSLTDTHIQEPANQKKEDKKEKKDYKTPQELFSSFNVSSLDQTSPNNCAKHEKKDSQVSKVQTTQSSSVNPLLLSQPQSSSSPTATNKYQTHLKLTSSFPAMQPAKMTIPSGVQTVSSTSKPLLVQGHTNPPPFYYMNQAGANGYIGYQPPFTPTTTCLLYTSPSPRDS